MGIELGEVGVEVMGCMWVRWDWMWVRWKVNVDEVVVSKLIRVVEVGEVCVKLGGWAS